MRTWVAAIAMVALSMGALAHEGMHGPGAEYDTDADGSLSVKEFSAYLQATKQDVTKAAGRFAALDTNKDGKLSSGEFARGLKASKPG